MTRTYVYALIDKKRKIQTFSISGIKGIVAMSYLKKELVKIKKEFPKEEKYTIVKARIHLTI